MGSALPLIAIYPYTKVLDGWTDGRTDKAATVCFAFGEHNIKLKQTPYCIISNGF